MRKIAVIVGCLVACLASGQASRAASHREAPLTALDHPVDITDFYAFVSYDDPDRVTLIMSVDPFLEPSNGPNYFPFDDNVTYAIHIDNNKDGVADVTFDFRFQTEIRLPQVFTGLLGAGGGVEAPANSAPPVAPGTPIIPPAITALDGAGSEGLSLRQRYTVTLTRGRDSKRLKNMTRMPLFAVPSNVGPRTMPDYAALADQGIYALEGGVRVFAGTTDDAFWIDLGAAFDTLNFRDLGSGIPGVLTDSQDSANANFATDAVSGFNVNTIAIEVPVQLLTRDRSRPSADDPKAVIGAWGKTSRPAITIRRSGKTKDINSNDSNDWAMVNIGGQRVSVLSGKHLSGGSRESNSPKQLQRMANPLVNELIIDTGFKDDWSRLPPSSDSQFAPLLLDPLIARAANAAYAGALVIPPPPREDLLLLVQYLPPIAPPGTSKGPIADLLRLNVGIPATSEALRSRLGVIGGDLAGFPNGRRVFDDVTDIALRVVVGGVLTNDEEGNSLNRFPNNRLGDGVNVNDLPYRETFPYVALAHSGRTHRHVDPGEPGGGPAE